MAAILPGTCLGRYWQNWGGLAVRPPSWLAAADSAASIVVALALVTQPGTDNLLTLLALLAVYWLVGAALEVVDLVADHRRWAWKALGAASGVAAALVVLRQPLWSTVLVPAVLARTVGGFGIAVGVVRLLRRSPGVASA